MLAGQWERRLLAVVERPPRPASRIVTSRAIWTQASPMHIFRGVARNTVGLRIEERRALVALLAFHACVFSEQRKIRLAVIEADVSFPGYLTMALATSISQLAFVRIIITVTPDTGGGRRFHMRRLFVTGGTSSCCMLPIEREVRIPLMLETNRRPTRFRVTVLAIGAE